MAHTSGTTTSIDDLMSKIATFVSGMTDWTQETTDLSADHVCFSSGNCYVSFRWDATTKTMLAMYQSLGFTNDATLPHLQPNDSGNGSTVSPAISERRINFTDGDLVANAGPYVGYEIFARETNEPTVYVVVEMATGVFRHFCFGHLLKSNDYTGGEFVCGHLWNQGTLNVDRPANTSSHFLLDGLNSTTVTEAATVHIEGLPGMGVNDKWGVCTSGTAPGTDTAGEDRVVVFGTSRTGLYGYHMAWMRASALNAYKPLLPVVLLYRDTLTAPDTWYWLGEMPDVAIVNMAYFSAGDTIVVGGDNWVVYPWVRKRYTTPDSNTEESWNAGVAYKKVV